MGIPRNHSKLVSHPNIETYCLGTPFIVTQVKLSAAASPTLAPTWLVEQSGAETFRSEDCVGGGWGNDTGRSKQELS